MKFYVSIIYLVVLNMCFIREMSSYWRDVIASEFERNETRESRMVSNMSDALDVKEKKGKH